MSIVQPKYHPTIFVSYVVSILLISLGDMRSYLFKKGAQRSRFLKQKRTKSHKLIKHKGHREVLDLCTTIRSQTKYNAADNATTKAEKDYRNKDFGSRLQKLLGHCRLFLAM